MTFFQWIPEGALCFQPGARAFAPLRVRRSRAAGPGLLRGLRGATALEGAGKGRMKVGDLGLVHSVDLFVYPLVNIYKKLWKRSTMLSVGKSTISMVHFHYQRVYPIHIP